METTDLKTVVFPPSNSPKTVKLVIRNTSTDVLVAKIKVISVSPKDTQKNQSALIPPGTSRNVSLVLLPANFVGEFSQDEKKPLQLVVKENDKVEVYCRLFSVHGDLNLAEKYRLVFTDKKGDTYKASFIRKPIYQRINKMDQHELAEWWQDKLVEYADEHEDRFNELLEWVESDIDEPERLAHKLQMVRDAKRFAASTVLVEIPGNASLIESVPYTEMLREDLDCQTARSMTFGTSTACIIDDKQLLMMAPSLCITGRTSYGGFGSCDWFSRWLSWFLPLKTE